MQISNMINSKGNAVKNQFIIHTNKGVYFKSYDSVIAFIPNNGDSIEIGADWDCSPTTGTYRNMFLDETKKDTRRKLDTGVYVYNPDLKIE